MKRSTLLHVSDYPQIRRSTPPSRNAILHLIIGAIWLAGGVLRVIGGATKGASPSGWLWTIVWLSIGIANLIIWFRLRRQVRRTASTETVTSVVSER